MKHAMFVIAEHPCGKHPSLSATATYCFGTLSEAWAFLDELRKDTSRTSCYHHPWGVS